VFFDSVLWVRTASAIHALNACSWRLFVAYHLLLVLSDCSLPAYWFLLCCGEGAVQFHAALRFAALCFAFAVLCYARPDMLC
jgi:hypothetical protein